MHRCTCVRTWSECVPLVRGLLLGLRGRREGAAARGLQPCRPGGAGETRRVGGQRQTERVVVPILCIEAGELGVCGGGPGGV